MKLQDLAEEECHQYGSFVVHPHMGGWSVSTLLPDSSLGLLIQWLTEYGACIIANELTQPPKPLAGEAAVNLPIAHALFLHRMEFSFTNGCFWGEAVDDDALVESAKAACGSYVG